MRYLPLIYGDESRRNMSPERIAEWMAYDQDVRKHGVYVGGEPLQFTDSAKTLRPNGAKTITTDGPFAETKEQLGGYFPRLQGYGRGGRLCSEMPSALDGSHRGASCPGTTTELIIDGRSSALRRQARQ
jgi:hypothetical protein